MSQDVRIFSLLENIFSRYNFWGIFHLTAYLTDGGFTSVFYTKMVLFEFMFIKSRTHSSSRGIHLDEIGEPSDNRGSWNVSFG